MSYKATFSALGLIKQLLAEKQIPLVFILAPSVVQVQTELWQKLIDAYQLHSSEYDLRLPQKRLTNWFNSNNCTYLDLQPFLEKAYQNDNKALYFERNEHWNIQGHKQVATFLLNHFTHE